jgi:hypothetical protein
VEPVRAVERQQQIALKMNAYMKAATLKLIGLFRRGPILLMLLSLILPNLAEAWNDKTHMAIAYIAYRKLNRHAKERVDELLVFHPLYAQWTKDAKVGRAGLLAFVHAATWPDCIQNGAKCAGYVADGTDNGMTPPVSQEAWQNVGYSDRFMHKYWHFVRQPYEAENQAAQEAPRPNLETQLQLLMETLSSNASDALKSYDLIWVENLVGEIHQPLNCISRFSARHPAGDENGRAVKLCKAPCNDNLHDYWDNLLGREDDFESGIREGKSLAGIQKQTVWSDPVDIQRWMSESVEVAKNFVYSPAITSGDTTENPVEPNEAYRKAAVHAAVNQVVLAGHRLASLLNSDLR